MFDDWQLRPLPGSVGPSGPVVLAIMDGVGLGRGDEADAVASARTPVLDGLRQQGLYRSLLAHGTAVGMPSDDDMGNSEVGHNALGAGRVFAQGALRVNDALADGSIFQTSTWSWLTGPCVEQKKALHLIGLLSDGNVHSHIDHLFALIRQADAEGVERLYLHVLLDGRDVAQTSAHLYLAKTEAFLDTFRHKSNRDYQIASGGGRMKVTMDRYNADWAMVKVGWDAHVLGRARAFASAQEALETFRQEKPGIIDQNLPAFVVSRDGGPVATIEDGDAVVLFNFRGDRAIEITQAFELADFSAFDRVRFPDVRFAGMMQYDGDLLLPRRFLVTPPTIDRTLGEYMARNGIRQFALSETQKFGHVTYFWNGNRSGMFDPGLETYLEIPSELAPFDERPWMKAAEITDAAVKEILQGSARFVRLNYANGDMVGHTGVLESTILAVEAVDLCLGRLKAAVEAVGGILVVTADHGNADEMYMRDAKSGKLEQDKEGHLKPRTSHSLNPVPFVVYDPKGPDSFRLVDGLEKGGLANVAATVLTLLGFEAPDDYAPSLVRLSS